MTELHGESLEEYGLSEYISEILKNQLCRNSLSVLFMGKLPLGATDFSVPPVSLKIKGKWMHAGSVFSGGETVFFFQKDFLRGPGKIIFFFSQLLFPQQGNCGFSRISAKKLFF